MLRQVLLQLSEENRIQQLAEAAGVRLTLSDCRPFNSKSMTVLFELIGGQDQTRDFLSEFKKLGIARHVYESQVGQDRTLLLVVMDRPITCGASLDAPIICIHCPLSSYGGRSSWRMLVRSGEDLREIIAKLERSGVAATVKEISDVSQREELTNRQKAILATAVTMGYFDFPRRVSLTALSKAVGVKPSTLSEILRSAERKIMEGAIGATPYGQAYSVVQAELFKKPFHGACYQGANRSLTPEAHQGSSKFRRAESPSVDSDLAQE